MVSCMVGLVLLQEGVCKTLQDAGGRRIGGGGDETVQNVNVRRIPVSIY